MKGPAAASQTNGIHKVADPGSYPEVDRMNKEGVQPDQVIDYVGYEPPPGVIQEVDIVSPDIDPTVFFDKYIAGRKPVVIKGHLTDPEWRGYRWTNGYLKDKAGHAEIIVEKRGADKEAAFGLTAPKVNMTYGEFIDNVNKGDDRLYMTTQDLERFEDDLDDHDMPKSVLAEPLRSLQDDFSVQPQLVGNLIPYQLSVWQGIAKSGTSSGLHHDYHDNLYILLRGRKRFRMFAPSASPHMRTAGKVAKVHPNGLIVYRNKPDDPTVVVRADGVPISFLVRQKRDEAQLELTETEEALEHLLSSDVHDDQKEVERQRLEQKMEQCEARIDEAMEEMLIYGCPGDMCYASDPESDEDNLELEGPQTKKPRLEECSEVHVGQQTPDTSMEQAQKMPDHFCDMSFPTDSKDSSVVFTSQPHLKEVGCLVCDLSAGDMLYLPASWFHEVTSYSAKTLSEDPDKPVVKCSDDVGHLALNYWFYPPDNDQFSQPYKGNFWPKRWERILQGPPLPIQHVWSSDDEEEEGEGEEEEEEEEQGTPVK